ncbi:M12 family metallo-peptidase [uncultured Fibrella sp.]|uniref:M12 family metallo-peptidase n=1 Tax=uncultured Fibrella sp. TaxID=1284596 RepID=UPI0035CA90CF
MGKIYLLTLLALALRTTSPGQTLVADQLQQRLNQARRELAVKTFPLFSLSDTAVYKGSSFLPGKLPTSLRVDTEQLTRIVDERPNALAFSIPTETGSVDLELVSVDLFSAGSKLLLGTATGTVDVPINKGVFYQGFVKGNEKSLVAITITNGEVAGLITDETGNRVLSRLRTTQTGYLLYRDNTLSAPRSFTCGVNTDNVPVKTQDVVVAESISCKVVNVYVEVDFDLYTKNGANVTQTTNYVANLFNQVALIYNRENIAIRIAGIKVWTVADPYVNQTSTSDLLGAFQSYQNTNPPPGVNHQLAHLLSGRALGGGIAYIDVLCSSTYKYGLSTGLSTTYLEFPNYSWEVMVVSHEMGHNFGSPHTQSCSWPGGAIDNCYTTEGGCAAGPAPVNGGTIMSYCHLTSAGINLSNGFGLLPGNLIRSRVTSKACIPTGSDVPISLGTKSAQATSITTYWVSNAGSTQFTIQYRPANAANWTTVGPFIGQRYTLSGLQPNTSYSWRVTGECSGSYSAEASFTTGAPIYCTPIYSDNGCTYGIGLKRVVVNGTVLSNNSGCSPTYYTFYPSPVASLSLNATNPFTIDLLGYFNAQQLAIWIDFNQNYEFEADERVFGTTTGVKVPVSGSLTIPANVQKGITYRMRIRNQFSSPVNAPCDVLSYGEAEDYLVYVDPGCPPTPTITQSASAITCLQSVTLAVTNCTGTVAWLPGAGSGSSIVVSPTQTTNYTATCNLPSCSVSQQAEVQVAPDMVSLQSGDWDNPSVWSCQRVPTATTPLTISTGHTITLPANYAGNTWSLILDGSLKYLTNSKLKISTSSANSIRVR